MSTAMSDVEIVEFFQARCYSCGWSGEECTYFGDADSEGEAHVCEPADTGSTDLDHTDGDNT